MIKKFFDILFRNFTKYELKFIKMEIKILGTGCPNCKTLENRVRKVVAYNNIEANITKGEDIEEIMSYNILSTPGLVVDDKVLVKGRVPKEKEILKLIMV